MAITFVGSVAADANTVVLSSISWLPGDVALVIAAKDSAVAPTVPATFTELATHSAPGVSSGKFGYRILEAGDTDIGTWTNANHVGVGIYRGCSQVDPIGSTGGYASADPTPIPERLGLLGTGIVVFAAQTLSGDIDDSNLLNYVGAVNRSSGWGSIRICMGDTGGLAVTFPQDTLDPSGGGNGVSVELLPAVPPAPTDYEWSIISGALPTGLTLAAATGIISGTPTVMGTFAFVLRYANNYTGVTKACSITVTGLTQGDASWHFSFKRFLLGEGKIWHRHLRVMRRPAIVDNGTLIFTDATKDTFRINKDLLVTDGYWISPTLNREGLQYEETLTEVGLRYTSSGETEITIEAW